MKEEGVIIVGGGILQLPIINTVKKRGYKAIVVDINPNAPGVKIADFYIPASTLNPQEVLEKIYNLNLLEKFDIKACLTVGTDASYTVSLIAQKLNLIGIPPEVALRTTRKDLMREYLKENGVKVPNYRVVETLEEALKKAEEIGYPVVMKPIDNMGARGVVLIKTPENLKEYFEYTKSFSRTGKVLVEGYIDGEELSIDAIIWDGEVFLAGVADRIIEVTEDRPFFVETGHIMPTQLPEEVVRIGIEEFIKAVKVLGIKMGAAKGDVKVCYSRYDKKVEKPFAVIGEIASRLSGGYMSTHTTPYSMNIDIMEEILNVHLGIPPENIMKNPWSLEKRHQYMVSIERAIIPPPGIVKNIKNLEKVKSNAVVKDVIIYSNKIGEELEIPRNNLDKIGHVIGVGKDFYETLREVHKAFRDIQVEVIGKRFYKDFEAVRGRARERLKGVCAVCKICDGEWCRGKIPGIGGIGNGQTFVENVKMLMKTKLKMRYIHNVKDPDTSVELWGLRLSMPVLIAPITGTKTNLGDAIDEWEYTRRVVKGATWAGTISAVGDSATPWKYQIGIRVAMENYGLAIGIYKPREDNREVLKRLKEAVDVGMVAVGMDIDGCAFITFKSQGQVVSPKTKEELKMIIEEIKGYRGSNIPFILKGIMSREDARLAVEVGADAIIVSNHGGRISSSMPSSIEVLEEIVDEVRGSNIIVMFDSGIREAEDVLKALALGAKIVFIGRPIIPIAIGGDTLAVKDFLEDFNQKLKEAMILTGTKDVKSVSKDIIYKRGWEYEKV